MMNQGQWSERWPRNLVCGLGATSFPAPDGPDPTVAPHRVRWILSAISASQVFQGASYMDVYKGDKVYRPTGETPPPQ